MKTSTFAQLMAEKLVTCFDDTTEDGSEFTAVVKMGEREAVRAAAEEMGLRVEKGNEKYQFRFFISDDETREVFRHLEEYFSHLAIATDELEMAKGEVLTVVEEGGVVVAVNNRAVAALT